MKFLRIGAVLLFVLSFALNTWASHEYNKNHDSTVPVLTSDQEVLEVSVDCTEEDLLKGLTAYDEKDGDLTDEILIAGNTYFLGDESSCNVTYVVFDSSNNSAKLTRKVHYKDYTPPRFALSAPLVYTQGQNINFLTNVTAYDVLDGDITDRVKVKKSNVSNYQPGTYPLVLEVMNSHGDSATVELSVVVQEGDAYSPKAPVITLTDYLVYVKKGEQLSPKDLIDSVYTYDEEMLPFSDVKVIGNVNTSEPGTYSLVYSVKDEEAEAEGYTYLTVIVTDEEV